MILYKDFDIRDINKEIQWKVCDIKIIKNLKNFIENLKLKKLKKIFYMIKYINNIIIHLLLK